MVRSKIKQMRVFEVFFSNNRFQLQNLGSINPQTNTPYFHKFSRVTIRDMATAHELILQSLGIEEIYLGIVGSLGEQQLLEWAIIQPQLFYKAKHIELECGV